MDNFILNAHQSGFQKGKSTITQLIEVYHQFCQAVDTNKEMRIVFLDISKAFDKVWHIGLLYKLKKCGIGGGLLLWLKDYLSDRKQRVVINGQSSGWREIRAGVPQGSVLGLLLFLVFINDITQNISHCNVRLFADDTCIFIEVEDRNQAADMISEDLAHISDWSKLWKVNFSLAKTKSLIISNKKDKNMNPPISFDGHIVDEVKSHI